MIADPKATYEPQSPTTLKDWCDAPFKFEHFLNKLIELGVWDTNVWHENATPENYHFSSLGLSSSFFSGGYGKIKQNNMNEIKIKIFFITYNSLYKNEISFCFAD